MLSAVRTGAVLPLALFCALAGCSPQSPAPAESLAQARSALAHGEYARAEELAALIPEASSEWSAARMVAGEAATKAGRPVDALAYYESLASRSGGADKAAEALFYAAEIYRDLGQLSKAAQAYRAVLASKPDNTATHERLSFLLAVTGNRWEALPHYAHLLRSGTAELRELVVLADLDRPLDHREYIEQCAEQAQDDPLVRLGLAAHDFWDGAAREAEAGLRAALAASPESLSGQAMLGDLLVDGAEEAFLEWHERLPPEASEHPDIWYVRGVWARRREKLRTAAYCFWQALRLAPTHRRATYQLGQVLTALGEPSGHEFAERAEQLIRLTQVLDDLLRSDFRREPAAREATELLEEMGRILEAAGWALATERKFPAAQWPPDVFRRLEGRLRDDLPMTIEAENLALRHDFSGFPDHRELFAATSRRRGGAPEEAGRSSIRFIDRAAETGIDFVYFNGPDPSTKGGRMFEQNGGGAAVLDFDSDGWADVYFSQGAEWEKGADSAAPSARYTDRFYRNSGGKFVDVTERTGLGDRGFGQGCSTGDLDGDGFSDLYVATIGRNQLYRNNGDGTFANISDQCGFVDEDWTASCAIIDMNGDSLPDLFDVTYLQGERVYLAICRGLACSPSVFEGAPDRLYVNRGDGTFEPATLDVPAESSKGLGVLAADLFGNGTLSLLIANDQVANHLLRVEAAEEAQSVRLRDDAFLSGLAFNENGLAMACMGIAADDADGNGLLDFFVTNFHDEPNTFYLQDTPGLFVDASNSSGLSVPSLPHVGWGTQFLDADLDGEPDLVVANGHVDDYRDEGGEYHMRSQFFRNTGGGRFVELFAEDVGEYFGRKYLGRGLARLDWNRDGRMDFVVSNIGDQASLVTNASAGTGHFLNVRLHATRTARDAIGTIVEVTTEDRRWTKQLVAGDGYMASNERVLQFGLGDADTVKEVRVKWPSGETTVLHDQPVDETLQLIEGSPRVIRW